MKRPLRWALRIAAVLVVMVLAAVIAGIVMLDTIVRQAVTRRLHAVTGMEVKIKAMHIGLVQPTITIEDLKLYNTAEFGGALCLDMPEVHLEYDPAAIRAGVLHLPLVRLNLAAIEMVRNKQGTWNFDAVAKQEKKELAGAANTNSVERFKFSGIDKLDVSFGKLTVSDLRSGHDQEVNLNITNQVFRNVKSEADLTGMAVLLSLQGSGSAGHSGLDLDGMLKGLIVP
ncbi:MAG TPA: AsmA family protein [Verrucomicrobiae bacterium]|jgi:uncharacterized protein involved in outer membrane biogenesis|nr:AsmA family protein [Verrucomicrobiae bacterium]